MKLPDHWTDLDRALFLLDGAQQSLVDEYGATADPNAMALLDKYAERRDQLRREAWQ